ncbi:formyl transferase [Phenylobacterium sp.]|uniref:formyl transferase n=1 Tax=Phenylobacterium sp. TaxID=1871053 RepID=UPI002BC2EAF4|nr:formyl transferase [Phenylobacterium sp.]HLZ75487.1 formyl transferase [Phenylobacterium sp.]
MTDRIVVITCDGLEHKYVTNRISRAFDVEAILVTEQPPGRSWKTVLKKSPIEFLDRALRRLLLKVIADERQRDRELRRVFGEANCAQFAEPSKIIQVGRPKAGRLRREVERLAPDFLVIYGTGIIPDSVLGKAAKKAFNMHTGISPYYRGAACAFWPIHEGEPEKIGATVHECISAVDGGEIYLTVQAPLFRGDGLHAVFARAVKVGADGYVKVLDDAVNGRLTGRSQDLSDGREFRGAMRSLGAEILTRWRMRRMRPGWPVET